MKNMRPKQACGLLRRIVGVGARARSSRPARKLMLAALVLAVATFGVVPAVATAQQDCAAISALTLTSDTPGVLDVSWDAPTGAAPTDYRVNWARSGEDYPSWSGQWEPLPWSPAASRLQSRPLFRYPVGRRPVGRTGQHGGSQVPPAGGGADGIQAQAP